MSTWKRLSKILFDRAFTGAFAGLTPGLLDRAASTALPILLLLRVPAADWFCGGALDMIPLVLALILENGFKKDGR